MTTVDNPSHYNQGEIEVIDVIEGLGVNYHLGNAIKYIARCNHKGSKIEDLRKAIWYINREIKNTPVGTPLIDCDWWLQRGMELELTEDENND